MDVNVLSQKTYKAYLRCNKHLKYLNEFLCCVNNTADAGKIPDFSLVSFLLEQHFKFCFKMSFHGADHFAQNFVSWVKVEGE